MVYDLAIIGGGPAGYNAAGLASSNGLKTILFEKKYIGGVCLNEGCIPTKTLLYSAKTYDSIKSAKKYAVSVEGDPSLDIKSLIKRKDKMVKKLTAGVSYKLSSGGVDVVKEEAIILGEENNQIKISSGDNIYTVDYVLLSTGSETVIPPIEGLSGVDFWTSKEALEATELPQSLAIIGGGVIGIEFASFFHTAGVDVHVIEMMPEVLPGIDQEVAGMLRSDLAKKGVQFHLNAKVTQIDASGVSFEQEGKTEKVSVDRILVSVGRRAVTAGLGLETLSIELLRKGVQVNEFMQTSHPRVYAAGDITGFSLLAHTAIREGEVAVNHIIGQEDKMSYRAIPGVVYTNPELAGVGKTEEELKAQGEPYRVLKLPMTYAGRFMVENEGVNGLCKVIVDKNERIIGCHMFGNPASELIMIASIAVANGDTVDAFRKHIYPHPTVGEIIHETLFA